MANSAHKIIIKNFSSLIIAQVFYKIITFFMMIAIARYLGVAKFGQLSYALSFVWLFMFLSDYGLSDLFIRDVAHEKGLKSKYINNIITLKIFLGLVILTVIFVLSWLFSSTQEQFFVLIILGIAAIFDSFMYFFRAIFRAEEKMEYESILLLAEGALKLAVILVIIRLGLNMPGVILVASAIFIISLINFLMNFVILYIRNQALGFSFDFDAWLGILKSAFPFMSISILTFLNFKANVMLLSVLKGDASAGLYNANYKLIEQVLLLPITFSAALLPAFSRLSNSPTLLNGFMKKALAFSLLLSAGLVVLSYAFGSKVVSLIYGDAFSSAGTYLGLISWVLVPFFVKMIIEKILVGLRKQAKLLYIYLFGVALNLILNLILIPRFGINGASLSTLASETLVVFTCFVLFARSLSCFIPVDVMARAEKENIPKEPIY